MKLRYTSAALAGAVVLAACSDNPSAPVAAPSVVNAVSATRGSIGINVLLKAPLTDAMRAELSKYGRINDELPAINALTMRVDASQLATIQALAFVDAANPDAERKGAPVDLVALTSFRSGLSTWDQDAVNVTNIALNATGTLVGSGRVTAFTGNGVYVGVIDTGLLDSWRAYFPQERIATQFAKSFGGGGGEVGNVSEQPNKWEHDQNSHGTHVTSTILGYQFQGVPFNGTAPQATVIPVKVLNQNGSGWSSVVARGITYITDLKRSGALGTSPVVINMSLGGPVLDALEKAAVDYAVANGVIVVAAAGNEGMAGMGYPGAYGPVISVAASGWKGEWDGQTTDAAKDTYYRYWWYAHDVADPTNASDYYITDFSSRSLNASQDLDVAAPGSWVLGPYQVNSGQQSFYFLGGTSMASPHVAGIVALMAQKNPHVADLVNPGAAATDRRVMAEQILEATAIPMAAGSATIKNPNGTTSTVSWGANATGAGLATANAALTGTPTP
ncbi:MAG: S8 family peptidase [Gemmatimonadaceae bacterium]